jgi:hypothetical protein
VCPKQTADDTVIQNRTVMRYLPGSVDRRSHTRYRIWLPAQVDELKEGMAITHNASPTGVLMVAASTLDVGSSATITIQIPTSTPQERRHTGKVVRVERNAADPYGMWPYRIAVEFDTPDAEFETLLDLLEIKHEPIE